MVRFPHIATVTYLAAGTKETNGDLTPGAPTTVSFECRVEPSNGNGSIKGADGAKVNFSWIVYVPKTVTIIAKTLGVTIVIVDSSGNTVCTDNVKQFSCGQINSRLWL